MKRNDPTTCYFISLAYAVQILLCSIHAVYMNNSLILFNITTPFLINSITAHLALIVSIVILLFWAVQFTQVFTKHLSLYFYIVSVFALIKHLKNKTNFASINSTDSDTAVKRNIFITCVTDKIHNTIYKLLGRENLVPHKIAFFKLWYIDIISPIMDPPGGPGSCHRGPINLTQLSGSKCNFSPPSTPSAINSTPCLISFSC